MRTVIILHDDFEGAGFIPSILSERGCSLSERRTYRGEPLPDPAEFDLLVSMGGPMSANDPLPWIGAEVALQARALAAGKRVLGVCLGAQLLAKALGGTVGRNERKEIGWFEARRVRSPGAGWLPGDFLGDMTVLHWHGETFSIPPGASRLFESDACANQAFSWEGRALGLQFHLEVDRSSLEKLIAMGAPELAAGGESVQDAEEIRSGHALHAESCKRSLKWLLDSFLS